MRITRVTNANPHIDRPDVVIEVNKGMTLRVAGYDMLPHLLAVNGENYTRITWEEFRTCLTTGIRPTT